MICDAGNEKTSRKVLPNKAKHDHSEVYESADVSEEVEDLGRESLADALLDVKQNSHVQQNHILFFALWKLVDEDFLF